MKQNSGITLVGLVLISLAAIVLFAGFGVTPQAGAKVVAITGNREISQIKCRNTTNSIISATQPLQVAANASGYTAAFQITDLRDGDETRLSVYISTLAVSSGTHVIKLQGSFDGSNWVDLDDYVSPVTGSTAQNWYTTQSIAATGDTIVRFSGFPVCPYYRLHADADASNGPFQADAVRVAWY